MLNTVLRFQDSLKVLDQGNEDIGTHTLVKKELTSSGFLPDDVNSLFTSAFVNRCLHLPGLAL